MRGEIFTLRNTLRISTNAVAREFGPSHGKMSGPAALLRWEELTAWGRRDDADATAMRAQAQQR